MASSPIRYWSWGLLVLAGSALAQPVESVRDVQFTSQPDVTRVVIALSGEAVFHTERIDNPDRVFFDLPRFVPRLAAGKQRSAQLTVNDRHIRQIRVAENQPGLTRLVFDVESPELSEPGGLRHRARSAFRKPERAKALATRLAESR